MATNILLFLMPKFLKLSIQCKFEILEYFIFCCLLYSGRPLHVGHKRLPQLHHSDLQAGKLLNGRPTALGVVHIDSDVLSTV